MRALEHRVHEAGATRREEFAGGVAYFNEALPAVWDINFLRLDRPCPQPALEADRLQAGLGHRKILVEDPLLAERFGPGMEERGLGRRPLVALARAPGGEIDPHVRELAHDDVRQLRREVLREQLVPPDPGVIEQLVEASALWTTAGGRWLVLFEDDRPAAYCVVYSHEGLAQIEDVAVLEAFRRRGLAGRLLRHALELVAPDHDTAFLTAEADDWVAGFYGRLGFEHVEDRSEYMLITARTT
jgi:ribosomal protein S18 acetylase RimI-like enzyme